MGDDGSLREIFTTPGRTGSRFICELSKSLRQKEHCKYRCKVSYDGYGTYADSPELTKKDFEIKAAVSVAFERAAAVSHLPAAVLRASVTKANFQGQPVYEWYRNGTKMDTNERWVNVAEKDIGASYVCTVLHPGLTGCKSSEPRIISIEDFQETAKGAADTASQTETGGSKQGLQPKDTADMKCSNIPVSFERPAEVAAPKFKCFDSNVSRLHYFIANRDDHYATNGLEYLDYNAFLCTLLREQGYQRVVIVGKHSEDSGSNYPVITYDILSQMTFLKPEEFKARLESAPSRDYATLLSICSQLGEERAANSENPIRSQMGGHSRKIAEKGSDCPLFGKKVIRTIIKGTGTSPAATGAGKIPKETFESFVMTKIAPALTSEFIKTAIVLPLELFSDRNNLWDKENDSHKPVIDMLRNALAGVSNNVVIITADREDDFQNLFKDPDQSLSKAFCLIDPDINAATARLQSSSEPLACSNAFVKTLSEKGRIHIAAQVPGIDEIANLLLAMKLQSPAKYNGLAFSKIYSLAEYISINCCSAAKTQKTFPDLNNNTWYVGSLQNFAVTALQDDAVVERLIAVADTLWARPIVPITNLKSTYIERLYAAVNRVEKSVSALPMERSIKTVAEKQAENEMAMARLNKMIGLTTVKDMLKKRFAVASSNVAQGPGHYIFSGNPGTGKTVVARLIGEILRSQGLLRKGHLVEVEKSDLVSNHVGESALFTRRKCEEAIDGVLFIDEAYQLVDTDKSSSTKFSSSFDEESYTTLLAFMENNRSRICVICAGYPAEMEIFRNANPGMARRIPKSNIITFPDYSADELYQILGLLIQEEMLRTSPSFSKASASAIEQMWNNRDAQFGNAGDVRNFLDECKDNAALRMVENHLPTLELSAEDIPAEYIYEDLSPEALVKLQTSSMEKLDGLIGLANVKQQLKKLILTQAASRSRREPGHYIFAGNPGTGKTAVARMVGGILKAHRLLRRGHTVEVSIDDLVAEYQGQTAIKTKNQCMRALDGVLLVDEAYALVNTDDSVRGRFASPYCEEAYTTIMKFMTDHASRICVIFAGYKDKMGLFLKANEGMPRRIKKVVDFEDYSSDELMQILLLYAEQESDPKVSLSGEFTEVARKIFQIVQRDSSFGNAGGVIKFLDECIGNAIVRLSDSGVVFPVDAITLQAEDIPEEYSGYRDIGIGSAGKPHPMPEEKSAAAFMLLPRSALESLPDPYQNIDVTSDAFGTYCINTVARLETEYGTASAFTITPDGYAITCAHCVAQKEDLCRIAHKMLKASLPTGQKFTFQIVNTRPDLDMALIKFNTLQPLPYLKLADPHRQIVFGEKLALYGYPHSREGIMSYYGRINSQAEPGKAGELGDIYYIDGDARPGNSGGPIVAESDGCVIGILRGALGESEQALQNYMKPIAYFWNEFLI